MMTIGGRAVVRNLRSFRNALVQIAGPKETASSVGQATLIAALLDGLLLHLLVDPTTDIRGAAKALKRLLETC